MLDYNKLTFKRGLKTLIKNGIKAKIAELSFKTFYLIIHNIAIMFWKDHL